MQYPIAEIFQSPQGEGHWTGSLMTFIRFAGCNVGKPYTPDARAALGLNVYQERCTDWAGNGFTCDTNYRMSVRMTVEEIVTHPLVAIAHRVLLTGGEPLIHNLGPLCNELGDRIGAQIHIETSGTRDWRGLALDWVCVSPKSGYNSDLLGYAEEIKVLVGAEFEESDFVVRFVKPHFYEDEKVFISPVNGEHEINRDNLNRCLELQRKYPLLRLTTQSHKTWGVW